jgi:hypothetical protein
MLREMKIGCFRATGNTGNIAEVKSCFVTLLDIPPPALENTV